MTVAAGAGVAGASRGPAAPPARARAPRPPPSPAAEFEAEREAARARLDIVCALNLIAVHGWLLVAPRPAGPAAAALPCLISISAATLAAAAAPRAWARWYMPLRGAAAAAVRLGMMLGAASMQRAWPTGWAPAHPAAAAAAAALTLLSASRALFMAITATVRPLAPLPQLALSLAAFVLAARDAPAVCARGGPLARPAPAALVAGMCAAGDLLAHGALAGAPHAPSWPAAGDAACCRRAVLFTQLVVGVALPTAAVLAAEFAAARAFAKRRGLRLLGLTAPGAGADDSSDKDGGSDSGGSSGGDERAGLGGAACAAAAPCRGRRRRCACTTAAAAVGASDLGLTLNLLARLNLGPLPVFATALHCACGLLLAWLAASLLA
jgi:hypothetical protein